MKKLLAILLVLAFLTGCTGGGPAVQPDPAAESHPTALPLVETAQPDPSEDSQEIRTICPPAPEPEEAYAAFAVDLLRASRRPGENTLMSPLSVTLALGMTAMGAEGDTAAEFEAVLGMDKENLAAFCETLMEDYGALGGSSETNLVNSLWCDPELTLKDSFAQTCEDSFGAEMFHADLQSPETVEQVNGWVSDATRGMIPQVVNEFDPNAVLALVNAVYFKNRFSHPFAPPGVEWTMDFHNADGTIAKPQGMSNGEREERYLSHENGQGVVMAYDDGKLGLLLMLPDEGVSITDYLAAWNGRTTAELMETQTRRTVNLWAPKFKAEWSGELRDALEALGLAVAFDPETADFTGMGSGSLSIGSVIHKTAFEVNEKGTEAAAVTVVEIKYTGLLKPPEDLVVLHLDRPFVYGIVDMETGAPLFLGTMEQM